MRRVDLNDRRVVFPLPVGMEGDSGVREIVGEGGGLGVFVLR